MESLFWIDRLCRQLLDYLLLSCNGRGRGGDTWASGTIAVERLFPQTDAGHCTGYLFCRDSTGSWGSLLPGWLDRREYGMALGLLPARVSRTAACRPCISL